MGIKNAKTGEWIRPNIKSKTHGVVDKIVIKDNEDGEQEMRVHIEMNDL